MILLNLLEATIDQVFSMVPQSRPLSEALKSAKIVAHRGAHNNSDILENTLAAFDLCIENNIWGIEFDVRWTKDHHPVVLHDPTAHRIFGRPDVKIADMSLAEIKSEVPTIPSLQEMVDRYGRKTHLMIELKEPLSKEREQILETILSDLTAEMDYHLISLEPGYFDSIEFVPSHCFLLVAEINTNKLSQIALKMPYGGLTGHYLLLNPRIQKQHQKQGQKIGVGFIASKNSLYREINRGAEWIFTNHALKLARFLQ